MDDEEFQEIISWLDQHRLTPAELKELDDELGLIPR